MVEVLFFEMLPQLHVYVALIITENGSRRRVAGMDSYECYRSSSIGLVHCVSRMLGMLERALFGVGSPPFPSLDIF